MRLALLACVVLLGAGCSWGTGSLRNESGPFAATVPFRHVRTVAGSSRAIYLFCAIPIYDSSIYAMAMESLHAGAHLGPNQGLANMREDYRITAFAYLVCVRSVTISADIIEMGAPGSAIISGD